MSARIYQFPQIKRQMEQVFGKPEPTPDVQQRIVDLNRALAWYRAYRERREDDPKGAA